MNPKGPGKAPITEIRQMNFRSILYRANFQAHCHKACRHFDDVGPHDPAPEGSVATDERGELYCVKCGEHESELDKAAGRLSDHLFMIRFREANKETRKRPQWRNVQRTAVRSARPAGQLCSSTGTRSGEHE